MSDSIDAAAPPFSLALGPELTIAQAADTHGLLLETLSRLDGLNLSLDLSGVSEFDSSAIQLLLATQRSMHDRAASLSLQEPSKVVLAALSCYGLGADLRPIRSVPAKEASEELPCQ
jgi:anti-anti-sigma factor